MSRLQENYQKIRVVGSGSFGYALLCRRKRDARDVVVKVLTPKPKEGRTKVINEVRILKTLNHPNIIGFIEAWREGNKIFISMEYAEDGDLRSLIVKQKAKNELFPESTVKSYILQLACALYHIHSMHILHRDMKSENIFIAASGKVLKLGDFGISKQLTSSVDFAHTAIGTPYYMSPEIVTGRKYNAKSDIWAAGVILHELLTFEYPFRAASQESLFHLIRLGRICKKSDCLKQQYSIDLRQLLHSMLEVDSKKRLSSRKILQHVALRRYQQKVVPKPASEPTGGLSPDLVVPPPVVVPPRDVIALDKPVRPDGEQNALLPVGSDISKFLRPAIKQPEHHPTQVAIARGDPTKQPVRPLDVRIPSPSPTFYTKKREAFSARRDGDGSQQTQKEMDTINAKLRDIIQKYPLLAERRAKCKQEAAPIQLHRKRHTQPPNRMLCEVAVVAAVVVAVGSVVGVKRQFPRTHLCTGIDNVLIPILSRDMFDSVMQTMTKTLEEIDALSSEPNSQDEDFEDHMDELASAMPSFPNHNLPGITKFDTIHTQAEALFKFLESKLTSQSLCSFLHIISKDTSARVHPQVLSALKQDTTRYYCLIVQLAKYVKHTNIDQGRYQELRKCR